MNDRAIWVGSQETPRADIDLLGTHPQREACFLRGVELGEIIFDTAKNILRMLVNKDGIIWLPFAVERHKQHFLFGCQSNFPFGTHSYSILLVLC